MLTSAPIYLINSNLIQKQQQQLSLQNCYGSSVGSGRLKSSSAGEHLFDRLQKCEKHIFLLFLSKNPQVVDVESITRRLNSFCPQRSDGCFAGKQTNLINAALKQS